MTGHAAYFVKDHGVLTLVIGPEPNLAPGNAQFFDDDPACLIQLRPLLKTDCTSWGGRRGNALLYARSDDPQRPDVACYVRVPKRLLKNDRAGITHAITRVARFDESSAARLHELASRTRWPRPVDRTWIA